METAANTAKSAVQRKIAQLNEEIASEQARADAAEQALKELTDQQTEREQELISLQNRIALLEEEGERRENMLNEAKQIQKENAASLNQGDAVLKKVDILEVKLEETEAQLREALEKIRNLDLANENLQRKVTQYEKGQEESEEKYREVQEKYISIKNELDETLKALDDL